MLRVLPSARSATIVQSRRMALARSSLASSSLIWLPRHKNSSPFVVIRFKTCLAQSVSLRLENGISRLIPIFIQGFEPVYVGDGNGRCHSCFVKSATVRQSCHFRGEQFSTASLPAPSPLRAVASSE